MQRIRMAADATAIKPATAALIGAGVLAEAGCAWVWYESPRLTAIYKSDYTRAVFDVLPGLSRFVDEGASTEPADMAARLIGGLLVMSVGYLVALACARGAAAGLVVSFAALFRVTLALLPGLYSTDVFSYVMYGRVAASGGNPYVQPPAAFASDPFLAWVFPFWRDQPSVYGPLWTDLSAILARLTFGWTPLAQTLAYRGLLLMLEAATLVLLWWLLGRLHAAERSQAWLVYAWSPLVLFDLVGATHNDVAMLALLLAGLALALGGAWVFGVAVLALSALVKFASAVVLLLAIGARSGRAWLGFGVAPGARSGRVWLALGVALGLAIVVWAPWVVGGGGVNALADAAGGKLVLNSAPDLVALWLADQLRLEPEVTRAWVRWLTRGVFVAYMGWELWRARRSGEFVKPSARLLLALPLVVLTWVWSWYFSWSLLLAALGGLSWAVTRLVVAYTLIALPVAYAHQYLNDQFSGGWVLAMALVPLVVVLPIHRWPAARRYTKTGGMMR